MLVDTAQRNQGTASRTGVGAGTREVVVRPANAAVRDTQADPDRRAHKSHTAGPLPSSLREQTFMSGIWVAASHGRLHAHANSTRESPRTREMRGG